MNELALTYENTAVRTITEGDCTWWALVDVCTILELSNPTRVAERLDDDEKANFKLGLRGSDPWFINEAGLYHVILTSRSEKAKPFRRWVTHEVLPAIRKQGYYTTLSPEDMIKSLAKGLEYDHFMEDVVFPAMEMQDEFTFDKLVEHYCGFPVKNMDDFTRAKHIFQETQKERKQRLSALKHSVNDFVEDKVMLRQIHQFKWGDMRNRGHYKTIKGVRWFDDFILEQLQARD